MNSEELKYFYATDGEVGTMPLLHNCFVYPKEDVDRLLNEKDEEIEDLLRQNRELCQALQVMYSKEEYGKLQKEIESLKAKLESVQASAYADSVDAGMRERRLRRALWLARAERADDRARIFYFSDLESVLDIDGFSYDSKKKKGCKKLTARLWRIIWLKVERKCRDKSEEYK